MGNPVILLATAATDTITIVDVLQWCWNHILEIIVILSIFVEITPVKINPISWLAGILFKPLRKDMNDMKVELSGNIDAVKKELKDEIDKIKEKQQEEEKSINELITSNEMSEISRIRWEIIEFSNSIENKQLHIRDEYRHIIDDRRRYNALIAKYKLTNGIVDEEYEKIIKHYEDNKNNPEMFI